MDSILSSTHQPASEDAGDLAFQPHAIETARKELLLIDICDTAIAFVVPLVVLYVSALIIRYSWQATFSIILVILLVLVSLMARRLARMRAFAAASRLFLTAYMTIVIANAWLIEGLFDVIAAPLIVFIIVAGMLMGTREVYGLSAVAGTLWLLTRFVLHSGIISPVSLPGSMGDIVAGVVTLSAFFFVAMLGQMAAGSTRRSLDDATRDLLLANRKLENASNLKSRFTARTSHELRTPLGAIVVTTDLMQREAYGPLTPKQADSLDRMMRSAKRLKGLIDDVLDLSKIEAGELELAERFFEVNRLVESALSSVEIQAQEKGLKLSMETSPEMPRFMIGDDMRLSQVLVNLIHNAIKFTERGEVSLSIEPTDDDNWRITVQDTGQGIHEDSLERIFQEYQQEPSADATEQSHGSGLGLAITRHIVEIMGGKISVDSAIGQGSTFQITLPLRTPEMG
jgi:signal transduction histidine kinase